MHLGQDASLVNDFTAELRDLGSDGLERNLAVQMNLDQNAPLGIANHGTFQAGSFAAGKPRCGLLVVGGDHGALNCYRCSP